HLRMWQTLNFAARTGTLRNSTAMCTARFLRIATRRQRCQLPVDALNLGAGGNCSMPRYHFNLHDGHGVRPDLDGIVVPHIEAAHEHGLVVAGELMRNREPRARFWKLGVCDADGEVLFEIDFAQVDHTLDHLAAGVRESLIHFSEIIRTVAKTIAE